MRCPRCKKELCLLMGPVGVSFCFALVERWRCGACGLIYLQEHLPDGSVQWQPNYDWGRKP